MKKKKKTKTSPKRTSRNHNRRTSETREVFNATDATPQATSYAKPVHCDDHGVFVLQLEGRKHWTIWDAPTPLVSATAWGFCLFFGFGRFLLAGAHVCV
jgi:hypothetical protein